MPNEATSAPRSISNCACTGSGPAGQGGALLPRSAHRAWSGGRAPIRLALPAQSCVTQQAAMNWSRPGRMPLYTGSGCHDSAVPACASMPLTAVPLTRPRSLRLFAEYWDSAFRCVRDFNGLVYRYPACAERRHMPVPGGAKWPREGGAAAAGQGRQRRRGDAGLEAPLSPICSRSCFLLD
jgi:hypothetical protein